MGRLARYALRVSLLSQCQYRCGYCLPGEVQAYARRPDWLRAEDYARLGPLFLEAGVAKIRFTGGEPLLREDCADVVRAFRETMPGVELALTTNGERLQRATSSLLEAGLERVTLHIDSLDPDRYQTLMGTDASLEGVLEALAAANDAFEEVKVNTVLQRGKNDDEGLAFLRFAQKYGVQVRFIELMNTGSARGYVDETFLAGRNFLENLAGEVPVRRIDRRHPSDPASLFEADLDGEPVVFGLIASDTEPFCEACDRLRLTADGRLRGCLYEAGGVPVGAALKAGADEEQLKALLGVGLADKRSHHPLVAPSHVPFSMADVGG